MKECRTCQRKKFELTSEGQSMDTVGALSYKLRKQNPGFGGLTKPESVGHIIMEGGRVCGDGFETQLQAPHGNNKEQAEISIPGKIQQ